MKRIAALGLLGAAASCSFLVSTSDLTNGSADGADAAFDVTTVDEDASQTTDGGGTDASSGDAEVDTGDAAGDGGCAWNTPFTNFAPVGGVNGGGDVASGWLTRDELGIYYQFKSGATYDLVYATRALRGDSFGDRVPLDSLNSPDASNGNPSLSADERVLVFASERGLAPGLFDLWVSTRATSDAAFDPPAQITSLSVSGLKAAPFLTYDGTELWFSIYDGNGRTTYLAPRADASFQPATLRSDVTGGWAVLSDDKLTVYYAQGTLSSNNAMRVAHRNGPLDPFPPGNLVTEINSGKGDTPSWLSPDRCRLYFTTRRNTVAEIWVAERTL